MRDLYISSTIVQMLVVPSAAFQERLASGLLTLRHSYRDFSIHFSLDNQRTVYSHKVDLIFIEKIFKAHHRESLSS